MMLVFVFYAISVVLELGLLEVPKRYKILRMLLGSTAIGLLLALSVFLLSNQFGTAMCLAVLLNAYRVVNIARILQARLHPVYLRRGCLRTTCWLVAVQISLYGLNELRERLDVSAGLLWTLMVIVQLGAALVLLMSVLRHVRHADEPQMVKTYVQSELPSITVAVAARNETQSLNDCIVSLLASNYPKLEILVLDDCSQTRRTPEIIRSFAHDGVRFVPGDEPGANWLARNQAYDTLARDASGSYILYCSTSIRLEPDSIRKLVCYAMAKNKTMVSVMPRYASRRWHVPLIEPMRAAWELVLPRQLMGRPPVTSSCWLIQTSTLRKLGGFKAVSRMMTPEVYFARSAAAKDQYGFLPGGAFYGVSSDSSPADLREAMVRTNYPALHRRPEVVAAVSAGLLLLGVLPYIFLAGGLAAGDLVAGHHIMWLGLVILTVAGVLFAAYTQVLRLTYGRAPLWHVLCFPAASLSAIALLHYSLYKYEFSDVLWKERSICLPVMQVIPHLPST